ncbi:MAG: glycosyltransferase family 9 protein [Armatimonadetes bacterium]|nr:glycosyltransferase family 9 protein [Armatimonadota bacterium]
MRSALVCRNPQRVLIVRLSAIGDTVLTTPLVEALNRHLPGTEVDWVVEPKSRAVVEMCRGVSRVFTFPRFPGAGMLNASKRQEFLRQLALVRPELQARRYDVALAVQDRLKSGLALTVSGAKYRVGWRMWDAEELNWVFTNHWMAMPRSGHVVDRWMSMLAAVGVQPERARFPIEPPAEARKHMRQYLSEIQRSSPVVVMNVGSSKADRRWPAERFSLVAEMARSQLDAVSIFTWGNDAEREIAQQAVALSNGAAVLCRPTTLFTLAALVEQVDAFVGGDTGPMHLAAALGTPVVGVFAASTAARTGPYGDIHRVIDRHAGAGRSDVATMEDIQADEVFMELAKLLEERPLRNRLELQTAK